MRALILAFSVVFFSGCSASMWSEARRSANEHKRRGCCDCGHK